MSTYYFTGTGEGLDGLVGTLYGCDECLCAEQRQRLEGRIASGVLVSRDVSCEICAGRVERCTSPTWCDGTENDCWGCAYYEYNG